MVRKIIGSIQLNPGSEPASPVEGQMYYDSTDQKVKFYNGTSWENIEGSSSPAFWLDSDLYEIYDDPNNYDTDTFTSNDKWETGGDGSKNIVESTNSVNAGKEFRLRINNHVNSTLTTKELKKNKHTFFTCVATQSTTGGSNLPDSRTRIVFGGSFNIARSGFSQQNRGGDYRATAGVSIIAKGNDLYDVYIGTKILGENVENTSGQLTIIQENVGTIAPKTMYTFFGIIYQSKAQVN